MEVLEAYSLRNHNTFGLDISADFYLSLNSLNDIVSYCQDSELSNLPFCVLGGGSNVIFANDFHGLVLHVNLKGKEIVAETENHVELKVAAGENWHQTVLYAVAQGWWGVENLSLIPGTVGAAPIQNIGAYGVEICDVFKELEAVEISTGNTFVFEKKACEFAYRESVFKNKLAEQYIITSVTLQLAKQTNPILSYSELERNLQEYESEKLTPKIISDAVCNIRQSKLPDPEKIGNAGSFFKNPIVNESFFQSLQDSYPELRYFKIESEGGSKKEGEQNHQYKLAAAWLIDQCGWKGASLGGVGVYEKQALVLVNRADAKPDEVLQLAENIRQSVRNKFGVELEREPVLVKLESTASQI